MSNNNDIISLPNYIFRSLTGAWNLVRVNKNSMEHFDISSDGFWKSFWAIIVMLPIFLVGLIYGSGAEGAQPVVTESIFFLISLPMMALVMYYFTRFMKISDNYPSMIIASNWLTALNYNILVIAGLLLNLFLPNSEMALVIIYVLSFYFGLYVAWFMYKTSLNISGYLAVGVLLFDAVFSLTIRTILLKVFDPEVFERTFAAASNLPS